MCSDRIITEKWTTKQRSPPDATPGPLPASARPFPFPETEIRVVQTTHPVSARGVHFKLMSAPTLRDSRHPPHHHHRLSGESRTFLKITPVQVTLPSRVLNPLWFRVWWLRVCGFGFCMFATAVNHTGSDKNRATCCRPAARRLNCVFTFHGSSLPVPAALGLQLPSRCIFISQKVFIKSFRTSQFLHKSVNLSFIVTNGNNQLTNLCGN